jgi:hypothetical protein
METELVQLFGKSPREWLTDGTSLVVLTMILGRLVHALAANGGLVGAYRAIIYGTNIPKAQPTKIYEKP